VDSSRKKKYLLALGTKTTCLPQVSPNLNFQHFLALHPLTAVGRCNCGHVLALPGLVQTTTRAMKLGCGAKCSTHIRLLPLQQPNAAVPSFVVLRP
jgi:hypothetical protein